MPGAVLYRFASPILKMFKAISITNNLGFKSQIDGKGDEARETIFEDELYRALC